MRSRTRTLLVLAAVTTIALISAMSSGGSGAAQTGGGVAPDLAPVVRLLANGTAGDFGQRVSAKPGDLVQFRVLVRNYNVTAGRSVQLEIDRGPAKTLSAVVSSAGVSPRTVSVTGKSGDAIAFGILRFDCAAPPTFCPVQFRKPGDEWRASYILPDDNIFAIFSATVVEPTDRP
jgi:hypothetical protein